MVESLISCKRRAVEYDFSKDVMCAMKHVYEPLETMLERDIYLIRFVCRTEWGITLKTTWIRNEGKG